MAQRRNLRASDADREQIADHLRQASTEGRLAADELEQRLGVAFTARTYAELDAVVSDLPGKRVSRPHPRHTLASRPVHPIVVLAALPFLLAAVAILTGLAALWTVWVVFAWLAFGQHGRYAARWACAGHRGVRRYPRSSAPSRYWA